MKLKITHKIVIFCITASAACNSANIDSTMDDVETQHQAATYAEDTIEPGSTDTALTAEERREALERPYRELGLPLPPSDHGPRSIEAVSPARREAAQRLEDFAYAWDRHEQRLRDAGVGEREIRRQRQQAKEEFLSANEEDQP